MPETAPALRLQHRRSRPSCVFGADFTPHGHTTLGFQVPNVEAPVAALREKGVAFNIYPGFGQNKRGVLTLLGGTVRTASVNHPDGNVLRVTNA